MQPSSLARVRVLCLALLILLTALPVPVESVSGSSTASCSSIDSGSSTAAGSPALMQQDRVMVVMMLAPLVELYEGDTISLPYFVQDISPNATLTLVPLTPGTASVTASLGLASVTANGLRGTLNYTAQKAGEDVLTVTVSNYFGTATGTTTLTVKPRPNYNLDYLVVSQAEDAAGGFFMALFNGKGAFANVPDHPIEGKGSADYWFSLGVDSEVVQLFPLTARSKVSVMLPLFITSTVYITIVPAAPSPLVSPVRLTP